METLDLLLADIDQMHRDRDLDVRHHDKFVRRLEHNWPAISRAIRRLLDEAGPPRIEGAVSYLGPLDHVRQVGRGAVDRFADSEHAGILLHLSRDYGTASGYRLLVAFTEPAT